MSAPNAPRTSALQLASPRATGGVPAAAAPSEDEEARSAALDRLADQIADRLAVRLAGLIREHPEPLVDAGEIARIYGKTRSWVYEHAGELGAIRLGTGSRPRLGFSPARVATQFEKLDEPSPGVLPPVAKPRRRRRRRAERTAAGAELLPVRGDETDSPRASQAS
jgi:hypothetical protein